MAVDGVEELKAELIKTRLEAEQEEEALDLADQPTADLVRVLLDKTRLLARKEIELARVELKADFKEELATVKSLAAGGLLALFGVNMLFVCAAFALAAVIPGWLAALLIGVGLLMVAGALGLWGWGKRVKEPLAATRRSLEEDVEWAKRRLV